MEKALKYERQMKWAMIFVIVICAGMVLLDFVWVTAGGAQIGGPVACFTVAMYSLGRTTIKGLKGEIERLKSGGVEA